MEQIQTLVNEINNRKKAYFDLHYPRLVEMGRTPVAIAQVAKKYVKIWITVNGVRESIHSFINPQTGEIFMAAGCNAPAKGARGVLTSETKGFEALTPDGNVRYAKGKMYI